MNWTITTRTMPHTILAGGVLTIDFYGNMKELEARLYSVVGSITPIGDKVVAVSETGREISAYWDSDAVDVVFETIA